jgi:transposase InsO family protein
MSTEVEKCYQTLQDYYYGISEKAVAWVLDKCALCKLSSRNEGRATIKPIVAKHCMDRLVIDLMDFRSQADDGFKWILQIKDHFSRYVWAFAMKDKESATVGALLLDWFHQNRFPVRWYVAFSVRIQIKFRRAQMKALFLLFHLSHHL